MRRYFIQRAVFTILSLFGATFLAFTASKLAPGDPLTIMMGEQALDPTIVEAWRLRYGFDKPLIVQYFIYIRNALEGDLGLSYRYVGKPVTEVLAPAILATLKWESMALAIALVIGMVIGTVSAIERNTWIGTVTMTFVLVGISLPEFVLATFLILIFALKLRLLPVAGFDTPVYYILPSVTMAVHPCALLSRIVRASMLEVLGQDYMISARAKGLSEFVIITRHGLRNALLPVLTVIGVQVGRILSGAFIIETIFNIPGLGRVGVTAVLQRDYPVILGVTILLAVAFLVASFVVDMLYGVLDPRIRLRRS